MIKPGATYRWISRNSWFATIVGVNVAAAIAALNEGRATQEDLDRYRAWNLARYMDDGDKEGFEGAEAWAQDRFGASTVR